MIVEYIRYTVPGARADEFVAAYRRAGRALDAEAHCLGYEVSQGVEEPEQFVVRIEWDSIEGHENGFRASVGFSEFLTAVWPFFSRIAEMKHYVAVHSTAG